MAHDLLLREGRIGSMTLKHRILTGPMERGLANRDGSLNQRYIDYLAERARGGAALILIESTYVDTRGMGHLYQLGCHGDHVIPGLRRAAETAHADGAKIGLEIYQGGRQTPSFMSQRQPLAPSASVPCKVFSPWYTPREMTRMDIKEAVQKFADAARRVAEAGMDIIELHGAHGYLLCQFLSPFSNKRIDEYGGSLENRARFPLEVYAAVRKVVGKSFPIAYRLSAEEFVDGGLTTDQTKVFCKMLADAGIDLIDVSGGIYESGHMIIQGAGAIKGGFVRYARLIKDHLGPGVPVSVTQRLNDPDFADEVLRKEGLDFVSLSRAFHADPHYARKVAEGRASEICHCIACHHCTGMLEANLPAECAINPRTALERKNQPRKAGRPRKVIVIGGGPGGMETARILAEQGQQVTLYEKSGELGGQVRLSSMVAPDYANIINYLAGQLKRLKVDVRMNSPATIETIREAKPDAVVVATGAGPGLSFWPTKGKPRMFNLITAMQRPVEEWEERVAILGGDSETCFVALHLAGRGSEVHLIEPAVRLAQDKLSPGRELLLKTLSDLPKVTLRTETTCEEIGAGYVMLQSHGRGERLEAGSVVIGGRTADSALYEEILIQCPDMEVHPIGDAVRPRDIHAATHEAASAAELIRLRST